ELRSPEDLNLPGSPEEVGVTKQETKMAKTLIDSMAAEWKPEDYHDEYREALMAWIEKKIESGDIERVAEVPDTDDEDIPGPINMMEALRKSVEASAPAASTKKK